MSMKGALDSPTDMILKESCVWVSTADCWKPSRQCEAHDLDTNEGWLVLGFAPEEYPRLHRMYADAGWLSLSHLENLTRLDDLSPLEDLRSLCGLLVEGSMWATQHVKILEPIGRLSRLEYLSIANLRAADETLRPLFNLRNLQSFHAVNWWNDKEIEELRRLNPTLEEG